MAEEPAAPAPVPGAGASEGGAITAARRSSRPGRPRVASWWARRSLRARLTAAAAVVIAVGLVAASGLLLWRLHVSLVAGLDASVAQQAQTVAQAAEAGRLAPVLPEAGDGAPLVQVVAADGHVVAASASLADAPALFSLVGRDDPVVATATIRGEPGTPDTTYRVAAIRADTAAGPVTVYAALPTEPVDDSVTDMSGALALGVPVLIAVLTAAGWLLIGWALRPVEMLRRQTVAIPGTDLRRRLRPPAAGQELARLTATLNQLLGRIESATDRQREFVADAAHELRSPIATLRTQIEVAARSQDPRAAVEVLPELLADTDRLARLVDDLLALARLDADPTPQRHVVVDLDDLVIDEARAVRGRGPAIDITQVSAGRVLGDPAALTRVVRNLLDNATRHAATRVWVRLRVLAGRVVLTIADDGPGIAAKDRERVFERFTRLDDARSRDAGGAGLGLAIVADVVHRHGGTVRVEDNRPGARLVVTFPNAA